MAGRQHAAPLLAAVVLLAALFGLTQLVSRGDSSSRSSRSTNLLASAASGDAGAGAARAHPWIGDQQNVGSDQQSGTAINCLEPMASAVLDGVDVVAYWTADEHANATYGTADVSYSWAGYTWYFASTANRATFMKAPEKYAPQWGGFCAYGISQESWWTASNLGPNTDPDTWRIVEGKLYLFMYCTPEYKFMTHKNISAEVEKGNTRWQEWFGGTPVYNVQCLWSNKFHGGQFDSNKTSYGCWEESATTRSHPPDAEFE